MFSTRRAYRRLEARPRHVILPCRHIVPPRKLRWIGHHLWITDSLNTDSNSRIASLRPPMRYFIYCRKSSETEDRQVASIESQLTTPQRTFGGRPDIEIAGIYEESFSAKAPGRVKFGELLGRIER